MFEFFKMLTLKAQVVSISYSEVLPVSAEAVRRELPALQTAAVDIWVHFGVFKG